MAQEGICVFVIALCRTVIPGIPDSDSSLHWPWVRPHQRSRAPRLQPQSQDKSRHGPARGSRHTTLKPRLCQERDSLGRASPKTKVSYCPSLESQRIRSKQRIQPRNPERCKGPSTIGQFEPIKSGAGPPSQTTSRNGELRTTHIHTPYCFVFVLLC